MFAEALLCSEVRLSSESSTTWGINSKNLAETRGNDFRGCVENSVLGVPGIQLLMRQCSNQLIKPMDPWSPSGTDQRWNTIIRMSVQLYYLLHISRPKPQTIWDILSGSWDCYLYNLIRRLFATRKREGNLLRLFIEMGICFQKVHLLNSASYLPGFSAYRHVLCPYTVAAASH